MIALCFPMCCTDFESCVCFRWIQAEKGIYALSSPVCIQLLTMCAFGVV